MLRSVAKMAKKTKATKREKTQERRERRFEPHASTSPVRVYVAGAIGAVAMGAGSWAQLGPLVREGGPEPFSIRLLCFGCRHGSGRELPFG